MVIAEYIDKMWYLSKIGFFEFLPTTEVMKFEEIINHQKIKKNTLIQTPETSKRGLYFVKEGAVRVFGMNEEGKSFTLSLLGPYSTYGYIKSFSLGTENVYVETISDIHLCSISEYDFGQLLERYPEMTYRALEILTNRLRERQEILRIIATGTVKQQIMHLLVSLANTYGKQEQTFVEIPIPLTHQEIANMLGVTRESVSANIRGLKVDGFIRSTTSKKIEVNQHQLNSKFF